MRPTITRGWVGRRVALHLLLLGLAAAADAAVLFPQPIHLTRRVDDPITQSSTIVEEYYAGDRVVSASGTRVTVTDYARREITEIDRAAATYSITSFEDVAKARSSSAVRRAAEKVTRPLARKSLGERTVAGRRASAFEITVAGDREQAVATVAIDRAVVLSRDAAEVIAGAAFPNISSREQQAVVDAAGDANGFGLPVEQTMRFEAEAVSLVVTNIVTRVGSELPPADLIAIPAGARRVEPTEVVIPRLLESIERPPNQERRR